MANKLQVVFECHSLPQVGEKLPGCRRLGIQEAKTVVQDVPIEGQDWIPFSFELLADFNSGAPLLKGKFVQGPRGDPFIYLVWGERDGETWLRFARAKIPLNAIPAELIAKALAEGGRLKARIRMVDARGNPAMATLKPGQVEWTA